MVGRRCRAAVKSIPRVQRGIKALIFPAFGQRLPNGAELIIREQCSHSFGVPAEKRRFLLKEEAFGFHKQLLEAFWQGLEARINHHDRFHINRPNHSNTLAKPD